MLFGKFGVDVLFGLLILLLLFYFVELVLDLLVAIFQETLLEGLNSFFESLKLRKDCSFSCKYLRLLYIILHNSFLEKSLCSLYLLKSTLEVLKLDESCCFVVIVKRLIGV